ncbi:MAG: hypothetical protein C0179_03730 [Fervidicoccus sp.]|nr:MAG: hypothetical protein C0179_03730 [Fervidicoccus sp.]
MVDGKRLKCPKCGYVWVYRGRSEYYATCPRCLRKVNVKKYVVEQITASVFTDASLDKSETMPKSDEEAKETKDMKNSPNIFCKPKEKIYDLKLYINNLGRKGVKVKDWWEEEDKYCFEIE